MVTVNPVLLSLYRITGTFIHGLLVLAAPLLKLAAPNWVIASRLGLTSFKRQSVSEVIIWIHAASVGEIQAARALVHELRKQNSDFRFYVTTMTRQGKGVAEARLSSDVVCRIAPLDTPHAVAQRLRDVHPDVYICLETELWPMILSQLRQAGIPMLLLNGRLSERSWKRYRLIGKTMRYLLAGFAGIAVIGEQDAVRYRSLGAVSDRVEVCGNIKYDLPVKNPVTLRQNYRRMLHLGQETVFICGSTRSGEEKLLLAVYDRLKSALQGRMLWIVAPRHLERLAELRLLFKRSGLGFDLFSQCKKHGRKHDILLVDLMGELAELYAVGDYIFCGGSLVDQGGHNIMEPVRLNKPVYFGPFMKDFSDAVELVLSAGAGFQVQDGDELADRLIQHLNCPELYLQACKYAEQLAVQQQGVAACQADMVMELLAS